MDQDTAGPFPGVTGLAATVQQHDRRTMPGPFDIGRQLNSVRSAQPYRHGDIS
jgi:hypothetical protein